MKPSRHPHAGLAEPGCAKVGRIALCARVVVLVCLIALAVSGVAQAATTTFYVSPTGSDRNPGTKARPFRTLDRARDAARRVRRPLHGDVVVRLRGGTYRLTHPLTLRAADSGGNGYDVVYEAAPGAHPLISGGRRITGWTLFDRARGIYRARAGGLSTRQLYVDGRRAVARAEHAGPVRVHEDGDGLHDDELGDGQVAQPQRHRGAVELAVEELPLPGRLDRRSTGSRWPSRAGTTPTCSSARRRSGLPTRIENAYELLDRPA